MCFYSLLESAPHLFQTSSHKIAYLFTCRQLDVWGLQQNTCTKGLLRANVSSSFSKKKHVFDIVCLKVRNITCLYFRKFFNLKVMLCATLYQQVTHQSYHVLCSWRKHIPREINLLKNGFDAETIANHVVKLRSFIPGKNAESGTDYLA